MPTISQTPSVTVSVPVPTPVQQPKKPRGPVSFGGETPPQQSVPVQQPQQAPTAAIPPMRRQLAGVILPWSPPPKRMARKSTPAVSDSLRDAINSQFRKKASELPGSSDFLNLDHFGEITKAFRGDTDAATTAATDLLYGGNDSDEHTFWSRYNPQVHNLVARFRATISGMAKSANKPGREVTGYGNESGGTLDDLPQSSVGGLRRRGEELLAHLKEIASKGGVAAANKLTGEQRTEKAKKANQAVPEGKRKANTKKWQEGGNRAWRQKVEKMSPEERTLLTQKAVKAAQELHSRNPKIAKAREMAKRGIPLNSIAKELGSTWHAVKKWVSTAPPEQMKRLPSKVVKYARAINIASHGETPHQALTRFLGGRNQRRHGRSVTVFRTDNGDIAVRLYNTNVVTAHPNGQVTLNHGGYMSPTTRRFMGYANPVVRNVSFAGGKFMIAVPSGNPERPFRWEEYENGTRYPPPKDTSNDPVPERGRLTPQQAKLLERHHATGENTPLGMLGDSLAESGYPHTGALLSRLANGDPGTGGTFIGEYHPQYQQSPALEEHDFHFTPGSGRHDLHELHVEIPRSTSSGTKGQFRVVGSKPVPEKLSRTRSSSQEQYGRVKKVIRVS